MASECEHRLRPTDAATRCLECSAFFAPNGSRLRTTAEVAEIVRADREATARGGTASGMDLSIEWAHRWPDIAAELRGKEQEKP